MLFGIASERATWVRLSQTGIETTANVIRLDRHTGGDSPRYLVHYAFLAEGQWYGTTRDVSASYFHTLHVEDRVPLRYWRDDPNVNDLVAELAPASLAAYIVPAVILLVFLCVSALALHDVLPILWLIRHGVPFQTSVTGYKMDEPSEGETSWIALWTDPDGRTGSSHAMTADKLPPIGSRITLLTDPTSRRESLWDESILPRAPG